MLRLGRWAAPLESMGPEAPATIQPRSQIRVACAIATRVPGRGRRGRSVRGTQQQSRPVAVGSNPRDARKWAGRASGVRHVLGQTEEGCRARSERRRRHRRATAALGDPAVPADARYLKADYYCSAKELCKRGQPIPVAGGVSKRITFLGRCRAAPRSPSAAQGLWPPWPATCGSPRRCDSPTPRSRRLLLVPSSSRFCGLSWKWCDVAPWIGRS